MAVDSHKSGKEFYEVVCTDVPLSVYLNWSDLRNNHNKFYIVQVLQRKGVTGPEKTAYLYTRYGRVGADGVKSEIGMDY